MASTSLLSIAIIAFYIFSLAPMVNCPSTVWETWVRSLGREDTLEKEMATHSSILAWEILWRKESGGLQSMASQRVGHNLVTTPPPPS